MWQVNVQPGVGRETGFAMTVAVATVLCTSFSDALERTRESLAQNGFRVTNEVDVTETIRQKHAVGMERYLILDACHPQFVTRQAGENDPSGGLRLVCNVVVRVDPATAGNVIVEVMNPCVVSGGSDGVAHSDIAGQVGVALRAVIDGLAARDEGVTNLPG
jgi:uncharacterized protein (DUF302 family)